VVVAREWRFGSALERTLQFAVAHPRWAVLLVVVAAYSNTLHNQPALDDGWVIFDNSLIKTLKNVPEIFRRPYNTVLPGNNAGLYRPVTTLSYAINYAVGGPNVVGYHLVNIALHALTCLLVLELGGLLWSAAASARARSPGEASAGPLLGALLFAVHPVHVEAVTGIVGRAELLAALGSLTCLFLTCTRGRARWRYPTALAALGLGVLSKENAAVTPLLFALVVLALPAAADLEARPGLASPHSRRALWRAGGLAAGMAGAVGVYILLQPAAVGVPSASQWFGGQPRAVVFNTMTRAVAEYLRLLVFPHPLGLDFSYSSKIPITPSFTLACLGDTAAWLAVLAVGVASFRRAPLRAVGILWVFVALLPVLNIIPFGVLMAERLLYLPSVGFCVAAGVGAATLPGIVARRFGSAKFGGPVVAVMAAAFFALTAKTWTRNADWRNALMLYEAELGKAPNDPVLNNNLAIEYAARGKLELARERLTVTLRVTPKYWRAQVNMGIVAHQLHDDSAAIRWLEQAHQLAPYASDPDYFLARVLADEGKLAEAVDLLARAEQVAPGNAWIHFFRGWYLTRLNRLPEGEAELQRAAELDPMLSRSRSHAGRPLRALP